MQLPIANRPKSATEWQTINWAAQNRRVKNLRARIFKATQAGDDRKVRSLQKLMLRSRANTLMSVRRATQQNAGKYLCRGQNSVNPVWDGSLTFVKATEMSTPLGCFCDERTPEPTLSR